MLVKNVIKKDVDPKTIYDKKNVWSKKEYQWKKLVQKKSAQTKLGQ